MSEKRRSRRLRYRTTVRYGLADPPEHMAFVVDLSDTGICLKTNRVFDAGTRLYLRISIGDKEYAAEGVVAWSKKVPHGMEQILKCGMGIRFTRVDDGLIRYYGDKKDD
jgi:Tfp pilus assembly protein PilZ